MFSKKSMLSVLVLLLVVLLIGCSTEGDDSSNEDVVAKVNEVNITRDTFEETVEKAKSGYEQQGYSFEGEEGEALFEQLKQQIINGMVQEEVLLQEADKKGYNISEEAIDEELAGFKSMYPSDEEFKADLEKNKLTEVELKDIIARDMKIEQFIQGEIEEVVITEDEIRETYEQYKSMLEGQAGEGEEGQEVPSYEDLRDQLELQLIQQKEQVQVSVIIEELMKQNEVEILL